jgi:hypothetical protein
MNKNPAKDFGAIAGEQPVAGEDAVCVSAGGRQGFAEAFRAVGGAAIICGLFIYLPIPGARGAAFCLFPGMALRSWGVAVKGAVLGFGADLLVDFAWMFIAGVWEPRSSFNVALVDFLPPDLMVITHAGSPMPNSMKFGLGLVVWMTTMYLIWASLWRPRLDVLIRSSIVGAGAILGGGIAALLWTVAPLDGWWRHGAAPFGDLEPGKFLFVFLTTLPACSLFVGCSLHVASHGGILPRLRHFSLRELFTALSILAVGLGIVAWLAN